MDAAIIIWIIAIIWFSMASAFAAIITAVFYITFKNASLIYERKLKKWLEKYGG